MSEAADDGKKLDVLHGLFFDRDKKRWTLKVSIFRGRKLVSKRVRIRFNPEDTEETAILKRDAILTGYRMIGLTIIQRAQRRPDRNGGGE